MNDRLYPGDPGYEATIQKLIAKAKALGFRLATDDEKRLLDPSKLYSFSDNDGRPVAPVFVKEEG